MKESKVLWQVAAAHFVSHVHIMAVPALLPLLPEAMNVGFVELGIAIAVFNVVSALVQAPLGFMVDRWGARNMLMAALAMGAMSFGVLAAVPTYWCLLLAMGAAGVANGVYHPADYALLSQGAQPNKMGRAFSIHTFAGFLGAAVTPPLMVGVALHWGVWQAFAVAMILAAMVWFFLFFVPVQLAPTLVAATSEGKARPVKIPFKTIGGLTLLFLMLSLSTGGLEKFSVSALVQGFQTPLADANQALTAFLFASAIGVLSGGVLADRFQQHGFIAAVAFGVAALLVLCVIYFPVTGLGLTLLLGCIGFLAGVVAPSRDMLVRQASPVGAEGRTFGIVSTGFNMGGVLGPLLFGYLLDKGFAAGVFWCAFLFMFITTLMVLGQELTKPSFNETNESDVA